MAGPRNVLLRRLGHGSWIKPSYLPGRTGFLVYSPRTLEQLRKSLEPVGWALRLTALHRASGRFFVEPTSAYLIRTLEEAPPRAWWNEAHQNGAEGFFTASRIDRMRRLPLFTEFAVRTNRGFVPTRTLALRLESLPTSSRIDRHWPALGKDFDALWRRTPLSSFATSQLQQSVFQALRRIQDEFSRHPERVRGRRDQTRRSIIGGIHEPINPAEP